LGKDGATPEQALSAARTLRRHPDGPFMMEDGKLTQEIVGLEAARNGYYASQSLPSDQSHAALVGISRDIAFAKERQKQIRASHAESVKQRDEKNAIARSERLTSLYPDVESPASPVQSSGGLLSRIGRILKGSK